MLGKIEKALVVLTNLRLIEGTSICPSKRFLRFGISAFCSLAFEKYGFGAARREQPVESFNLVQTVIGNAVIGADLWPK